MKALQRFFILLPTRTRVPGLSSIFLAIITYSLLSLSTRVCVHAHTYTQTHMCSYGYMCVHVYVEARDQLLVSFLSSQALWVFWDMTSLWPGTHWLGKAVGQWAPAMSLPVSLDRWQAGAAMPTSFYMGSNSVPHVCKQAHLPSNDLQPSFAFSTWASFSQSLNAGLAMGHTALLLRHVDLCCLMVKPQLTDNPKFHSAVQIFLCSQGWTWPGISTSTSQALRLWACTTKFDFVGGGGDCTQWTLGKQSTNLDRLCPKNLSIFRCFLLSSPLLLSDSTISIQ